MDGDYSADRLIVQVESLLHLAPNMDFIDNYTTMFPEYDLVIIDESESILNQFQAETFKGKSKNSFEFMYNVIYNSKKLLVLDGDISNRTYKFIKNFGECVNIVNDIKVNQKEFILTSKTDEFSIIFI